MTTQTKMPAGRPTLALSGHSSISAVGSSLVIHEWTEPGPFYMHIHHTDDEAWHVLEGLLRFKFVDGEVEAPAGTTVFVPAGIAHTYTVTESSRYLIFLTPRLDQLIAELRLLPDETQLHATLAKYNTEFIGRST